MSADSPVIVNLVLTNKDTVNQIPARFDLFGNEPILNNPSEWDASVVRFTLPNTSTPIFTFKDGAYYMQLGYVVAGVDQGYVTQAVTYNAFGGSGTDRRLWDIDPFVQMLNNTITSLWSAWVGAHGALPTTNIPYFSFDKQRFNICLTAEETYFKLGATNFIYIRLNEYLLSILSGIPFANTPVYTPRPITGVMDTFWQLNLFDNPIDVVTISGTNYLRIYEAGMSVDNITDFQGVLLTSNLPLQNEVYPSDIKLPILSDYNVNDVVITQFRDRIIYNANTPWRQVSLKSNTPLNEMSVTVYIQRTDGSITPLTLEPYQSASIKIMFSKKGQNPYA